jgi:acyl transferase domain-containing protein
LFAVEYALAQLWLSWGVQPQAMLGHSLGEYVAACLAGVFTLEDALALVAARGKLMQALPSGAMLAVALGERELHELLGDELALAAVNGLAQCVVSGPAQAVAALHERLAGQGIECRRLHTSHAFHSAMMDPMLDQFAELVRRARPSPPQMRFVSNLTGTWITAEQASDPAYWTRHLRETVRFAEGVGTLLKDADAIFLEVGPGATLVRQARRHPAWTHERVALSSMRQAREQHSDLAFLLQTAGSIWLAGGTLDWRALYADERRMRVPLPTYPFERQRYWIAPPRTTSTLAPPSDEQSNAAEPAQEQPAPQLSPPPLLHPRPNLMTPYVAPGSELERSIAAIVRQALGVEQIGVYDNFFDLGGDSLIAIRMIAQLKHEIGIDIPVVSLYESLTIRSLVEIARSQQEELALVEQSAAQVDELEQKADRRKQFQQMQRSRKRGELS